MAQINEVEARSEDYSETLAFIGLVNRLIESLGPQVLPMAGIVLAPYTHLVLQIVVAHLWQRGYRWVHFQCRQCFSPCGEYHLRW